MRGGELRKLHPTAQADARLYCRVNETAIQNEREEVPDEDILHRAVSRYCGKTDLQ